MTDTYEAQAYCTNCGYEGPVTSPVGHAVYKCFCPLCACQHLRAVAQREWDRDRTTGDA